MSNVLSFKLILISLIAIIALELIAKRLKLPSAAALLVGGIGMAFLPGIPFFEIDPELVLLIFLPPLLMNGGYFFAWDKFTRHFVGILSLAVGAVLFTTLVVGYATHFLLPGLPWGCCFALGAIVSPPDTIAAKAILERVTLPDRVVALLEGESMLNDASGLVIYRVAIASVYTGVFNTLQAVESFTVLCLGGVLVGLVVGVCVIRLLRALNETFLIILASILPAWSCYVAAEEIGVSGVMAAVTYGMILGWHQHDVISATVRIQGASFWRVLTFLMESLVFILIGLSLRGVLIRVGGLDRAIVEYSPKVAVIVSFVVVSRFVWIFATDYISCLWQRRFSGAQKPLDWRAAMLKSWAGMRGVVTLAAALALPPTLPGRDLILVTSFVVILITVLVQGVSLKNLIVFLGMKTEVDSHQVYLTEPQSWAKLEAAQFATVKRLAFNVDGKLLHPRLLEQYGYRSQLAATHQNEVELPIDVRHAHYDIILAAIAAGREELIRLHRSQQLDDKLMHMLEHDLDLQEISAIHSKGEGNNEMH